MGMGENLSIHRHPGPDPGLGYVMAPNACLGAQLWIKSKATSFLSPRRLFREAGCAMAARQFGVYIVPAQVALVEQQGEVEDEVGGFAYQRIIALSQGGDDGFNGFFAQFLRNLGQPLGREGGNIAARRVAAGKPGLDDQFERG